MEALQYFLITLGVFVAMEGVTWPVSYTHLDVYKRKHIYNIYGFVRFADEIVDTFHDFDKAKLLDEFEKNYRDALEIGISLNPILHSFIKTQKEKNISQDLVDAFLHSMRMDLGEIKDLNDEKYNEYIYGSAEVVGLSLIHI